ncbi:alpha-galactosidase [Mucilaginibacter aquariorum]|uniref:Alpha-galactosidase n=1 Tax=Mucilaginibacter aquariorum TaxID=2967225 RepID=A0ABT1SXN4_9SPHI|nr:alpha-galactosidase [Mucilaginibacter aquariorum]MCQ6957115.1 alpha-galactosidase [Mucilaginibacter aquariorum]
MMFKIYTRCLSCLLFSLVFIQANAAIKPLAKSEVVIPFGKDGKINYNLKTGTFNVYQNGQGIFSNIYSAAKVNADTISSKDYQVRKYTKLFIQNGFGKGFKHTILLTAKGLPQMKQVFYTYTGKNYFLTEVSFTGTSLKTNYMAPVNGQFGTVKGDDVRTLFVPFDNDTFISYNSKSFSNNNGISAEVGTVFSNQSRAGIVAGSVEHEVWKTGVDMEAAQQLNQIKVWGGYTAEAVTRDKIAHGTIGGNTITSPKIFVGYFNDWRTGMEEYGSANRIAEPPYVFNWYKPTPVGWNSWGVIQEKITYDKAIKVANFFADSIPAFRTGNTAYIDLDSYWDKLVSHGDYSQLKQFADYCKSKGLEPGVYWAPFTDWGHKGGPDRKVDGSDYTFGDLWTKIGDGYNDIDGARAIDATHPGTQKRVAYIIGKLKSCGFKMIKIDFLGHASVEANKFYDPKVTTGMQAYRKGMEYLVDQLGSQMLIYAAISPSMATGRYVHMRRIACDAFKTIGHTQYTLNSVSYGWWQSNLYNFIDADHVVFNDETMGANRARMLSALVTGTWLSGDDFAVNGQWTARVKKYYQDAELLKLVKNGKAFRPVEGNTGTGASEIFTQKIGDSFYMAVVNYGKDSKAFDISAQRLGIDLSKVIATKELLQDNAIDTKGGLQFKLDGADAVLYKFTLKK